MKISQLSEAFEAFDKLPVKINTKLQVVTTEGQGVMQYSGILIDKDDFMVYLGYNEDTVTTAIRWEDISTIEVFDPEEDADLELMNKEPGSGFRN